MNDKRNGFNLILGDQLFADISALPPGPIVMVEDQAVATRSKYHSHKLVLTFSAMRHFAALHGSRATYFALDQQRSIPDVLLRQKQAGYAEVHTFEPADERFGELLTNWCQETGLTLITHLNPMFLTTGEEWHRYTNRTDRRLMADFYRSQRIRLGILVDADGHPTGGKWSFDEANRQSLPRRHLAPYVPFPANDPITQQVIAEVAANFPDHAGNPATFGLGVTHQAARAFLEDFLEHRIDQFGDYEDAISADQPILHHSLLSPLLNIGLLTPQEILDATLKRHAQRPIPLNSLEGFVRQIIGWREFVRGIHRECRWDSTGAGSRTLGPDWYRGTTGLPPLDRTIQKTLRTGWCHHIERLMILGSTMFMCDVQAAEVYRYFMEMFVDAAEWVMEPNVYGMSQFVVPTFATKPYISGSAYVLKMSDYPKGDWCKVWDGLYWRTVDRLKDRLSQNHRMIPILRGLEKLDANRRTEIFQQAEAFVLRTTLSADSAKRDQSLCSS